MNTNWVTNNEYYIIVLSKLRNLNFYCAQLKKYWKQLGTYNTHMALYNKFCYE